MPFPKILVAVAFVVFVIVAVVAFFVPHTSTQHLLGGISVGLALCALASVLEVWIATPGAPTRVVG